MRTKAKLLFIVAIMLLGLTTATIINISLNFRDYSIKSAIDKSKMTATIVKDGLTAHMVNGIMDKREYFLNQISANNEAVKSLWLVRSENVISQYGQGLNDETVRDEIDKKVLETGQTVREIIENSNDITLRVTIPYKATVNGGNTNCLTCHNVQRGDTLGAISMEFDISDMRTSGMLTILKILGINMLFLVIVLFLLNHYVTPYMKLFTCMQDGIKKAYSGDFTHKFETTVSGDGKNIVEQMNTLFTKMQETFGDIKYNLATFIPQGCVSSADPLHEAKTIINELSDVYKFKKTIELDASKAEVYTRIIDILILKYNLKKFALYEVNNVTHERTLFFSTGKDALICQEKVNKDASECRAYRTKSVTISTEFPNLCQVCLSEKQNYICIPFTINNDVSLSISITGDSPAEIEEITSYITSIKHYFEAAKPVIESQILMEKLKDTSLRDGMTGLYNRRFLEEVIDKIMHQATRSKETYSVLMLDVDFFKMVNDTYGHDVGDRVIVEIGKVLKDNIRDADLAIRYGGEEFVVMLHNASDEGTQEVASKIHSAFAALSFDVGTGEMMKKTMSIGISKFPKDGDTIWKCIKFADTALYVAKTTGRNKIVHYEKEMGESGELR
ncbi:diguanylate cyclase, GGDEF domain protein [Sulfurimonas gotlandica GD1]|uniref:Diguanylate cyclase, GGDEF domain protein n=1 Tax=Sulfurimonas gotlandica (strain DSM 19862 / JCM 16533 / GD1) TaxID=929558 RepID=B6BKL4_SULGG|nr:GGDEF domain-containing protein [Sulfurimonas gotlandica]EDZ62357.1 diguanylate cyclase [Sulfurimonas gotlandica GD1]EHP29071.1 diguanylate cyclase, GGDEF domain protein [Sulfurimonas gotlandica GD1]